MISKYKITGVGIDTTGMFYCPDLKSKSYEYFDYIHTSIENNNDFIISDFVKSLSGATLITSIGFIDSAVSTLLEHLSTIGRDKIDLLLIDSKCDWTLDDYNQIKESGLVESIGIKNPESLERILEISKIIDEPIKYISLEYCPLNFNYEIVKWCIDNEVHIIGFNPFGGHKNSEMLVDSFSPYYLLNFSSVYSSVVMLSGRVLYYSDFEYNYLKEIIGKDVENKYLMDKSINKLPKPLKPMIGTSIKLDKYTIPCVNPKFLFDNEGIVLNLGKCIEDLDGINNPDKDVTVNNIRRNLTLKYIPKGVNSKDLYSIYRYEVLSNIKLTYPEDEGYNTSINILGDNLIVITIKGKLKEKGLFKKSRIVNKMYVFAMTGKKLETPIIFSI